MRSRAPGRELVGAKGDSPVRSLHRRVFTTTRVSDFIAINPIGCVPMSTQSYEFLILGSGAGGKLLSWHMARAGHRTAVVERKWIGGSCPNINCLPSKNEIWSAKVADLVNHATAFGILTGSTRSDMERVRQRTR